MNDDLANFSMSELYRAESETQCRILSDGLVALEKTPGDPKLLESLMRAAHSLKGAARIIDLEGAVRVAHAMEDRFVSAQKGGIVFDSASIDHLLRGTDLLVRIAAAESPADLMDEVEAFVSGYIVHISTSEAVQVILKAQQEGVDVTVESCPHYFSMAAEDVEEIGVKAKCQPPLRKAKDQAKLWDELMNGNINWLTSDHSPCTEDLKQGNIFEAWGGISGAQNNVDLMFDLAVKQRGLAINKFVDLIATNPAARFNLPNKGEIAVSKDADIILVDPNQSYTVKREDLYYKNKHSAYEGRKIDCRVTKTILRGNIVFDLNQGIVGTPKGKLLSTGK